MCCVFRTSSDDATHVVAGLIPIDILDYEMTLIYDMKSCLSDQNLNIARKNSLVNVNHRKRGIGPTDCFSTSSFTIISDNFSKALGYLRYLQSSLRYPGYDGALSFLTLPKDL